LAEKWADLPRAGLEDAEPVLDEVQASEGRDGRRLALEPLEEEPPAVRVKVGIAEGWNAVRLEARARVPLK
jgi:hypothetical protein